MAPRTRGNTALAEGEALTQDELKLFEDNKASDSEPGTPVEPTPPAPPTPEPEPKPAEQEPPKEGEPPAPEPAAAPAAQDGKQRTVEYGAFHEERERRKEERARRERAEQELATVKSRFATLEEIARAASQPQPQPPPDVNTDPVGHFQAELAARDAKIAQFEAWQRQQQQVMQEQQIIGQIRTRAVAAEEEFAKSTPDYREAADYVQMVRNAQLSALGFRDPAARQQQIAFEALNMAAGAEQRGENPAQLIYEMAKASGWKPKAAATNGAAGTPAAAAAPTPDPAAAKKLETVAKGQAVNASLGKLNGQSAPTGELTLDRAANMSDEEFASIKPETWRKLMGG